MAKFIPTNDFTTALLNPDTLTQEVTDGVSYVSKAYRGLIILDRNARGFDKNSQRADTESYHHERTEGQQIGTKGKQHRVDFPERTKEDPNNYQNENRRTNSEDKLSRKNEDGTNKTTSNKRSPLDYLFEESNKRTLKTYNRDVITLIDLDFQSTLHSSKTYQYIHLPFTPRDIKYDPTSSFVPIATMGRNNPHYHFTGSEDSITFNIDWHSNKGHREDVLFFCRWIESLTKGNGYKETPHRVQLKWGKDNKIFGNDKWLVTSAPYTLSEFVDSYREPSTGEIVRVGLLPQQASQKITLKRITEKNRLTEEIMGYLPNMNGVIAQ